MWLAAAADAARIADLGERTDVVFTLENLNTAVDHPGTPFARAADTLALVEAVDSPHLRMNLDLYHAQIGEGNLIELVARGLTGVGEIQVADVPGRCEPGTGEINYPAIARRPARGLRRRRRPGGLRLRRQRARPRAVPRGVHPLTQRVCCTLGDNPAPNGRTRIMRTFPISGLPVHAHRIDTGEAQPPHKRVGRTFPRREIYLCHRKVSTFDLSLGATVASLGRSRRPTEGLVAPAGHGHQPSTPGDRADPHHDSLEPALTLSELANRLCVSVQTLYDLRSQGRGPRGFRVGRQLRFRASEIDAWLARMEQADAERHPVGGAHPSRRCRPRLAATSACD